MDNTTTEKALLHYERHIESLRKYYYKNQEKQQQRARQCYEELKKDEAKYAERLAKARERYHKKKAEKCMEKVVAN